MGVPKQSTEEFGKAQRESGRPKTCDDGPEDVEDVLATRDFTQSVRCEQERALVSKAET